MTTAPHIARLIRPLVVALAFAGVPAVALASASGATATTCATTVAHWGSLTKSLSHMTSAPITNVRAGRNACFDRMVVDLRGKGAATQRDDRALALSQDLGDVPNRVAGAFAPEVDDHTVEAGVAAGADVGDRR